MDISIGALTYHHFGDRPAQRHFEKCIGDCQAIANPLLDIGIKQHHVFAGANSIARPMLGYRYNFPINSFASFTAGAYYQNMGEFEKKGIVIPIQTGDLMPIAGAEFYYKSVGFLATLPVSVLYWRF